MNAGAKYSLSVKKAIGILCFFCIFYFAANSALLYGQDINNLHIEKIQEDGLTNDYIVCINQDKNGFLWFGTPEGLFRYDGYSFKAYKNLPGDTSSLINNVINAICPEKNNLWVGTLGGLSCVDVNTQRIKNFPGNELLQVYAILPKNDTIIWVGTSSGLFQFNKKNLQWKRMPALGKDVFVTSIRADQNGGLYITTQNGFYSYTKSTGAWKHYHPILPTYPKIDKDHPLTFCRSLLDSSSNLWLTTWNAGLVRFDTKTEKMATWLHQTNDVRYVPYKVAIDLVPDSQGNIWIANVDGGLTIFNPKNNKFSNYAVDWKSENKLTSVVISLFRDQSGTFWIGTKSGIFKFDPHSVHLTKTIFLLKKNNSTEQDYEAPLCMLRGGDSTLWVGMYSGLYIIDKETNILKDVNKSIGLPPNFPVFNIRQENTGDIWFNEKNLLVKISKKANRKNSSLQSEIFRSGEIKTNICGLYLDNENRIWIGTHGDGFFRFERGTKKFISYHYQDRDVRSKINEIRSFCEISKDSLLIAGENTGLVLLHANTGHYEKVKWPGVVDLTDINVLYRNGSTIWIGTENKGLWQTDTRLKKPWIVSINDGMPSQDIAAIVADKQGNIWSLTGAGVAELHVTDKKIIVFDKKDGIESLDGFNSIIADQKGNISFGSTGCIYKVNAETILKNTQPPEVLITDLKVFDKDYDIHKGQVINLAYNQNYFSFEYVALNYTQSKLNRYAYKMDGLDKKWNDAGSRRYVSYANLDEGTYVFNVKASNNEGVWNEVPARLVIVIAPPFWHRWWFYLAMLLAVSASIYSLYMYNINQLKLRLQLRDKIARDLHDDIGSTLSGINIFSKIALQKMSIHEAGGFELVEKISDRSQKTLEALSDIVWSINTRNDGMDNFLMKANEYLTVLEVQGIQFDFSVDEDMAHMKFGMILRRELYLIFKEAVCNASKYADCSFINISLTHHKDICTLTVRDNGKGFNVDEVSSGNGIYNMQQRAKKMNGELYVKSKKNEGTTITLNFRITRFR